MMFIFPVALYIHTLVPLFSQGHHRWNNASCNNEELLPHLSSKEKTSVLLSACDRHISILPSSKCIFIAIIAQQKIEYDAITIPQYQIC
jgi:hypothetical protein